MAIERNFENSPNYLTLQSREWAENFAKNLEAKIPVLYPPDMQALIALGCSNPDKNFVRIKEAAEIIRNTAVTKRSKEQSINSNKKIRLSNEINDYKPLLVYNGTPLEIDQLKEQMQTVYWDLPKNKILIIEKFCPQKTRVSQYHQNTKDQIESLFQQLSEVTSPLYQLTEIGILSHSAHFVRIPFYLEEQSQNYQTRLSKQPFFWVFRTREHEKFREELASEMIKLEKYAKSGDLAPTPYQNIAIA